MVGRMGIDLLKSKRHSLSVDYSNKGKTRLQQGKNHNGVSRDLSKPDSPAPSLTSRPSI
jgi:hypothetical protein